MDAPGWEAQSPEELQQSFKNTGVLLCLDYPVSSDFGIDLKSYTTDENFKGVKLVPPGMRFIHYGLNPNVKYGMLLDIQPNKMKILKYDAIHENLTANHGLEEDEVERYRINVYNYNLDKHLGTYQLLDYRKWMELSCYMNHLDLQKLGLELDTPFASDQIKFIKIKHRSYTADSSDKLLYLLENYFKSENAVMAELQLSFILFMYISSLESLEYWKNIIALLCYCSFELHQERTMLFVKFLEVLLHQLAYVPSDFFVDAICESNFLRPCLAKFLLSNAPHSAQALVDRKKTCLDFLSKQFNVTLTSDDVPKAEMSHEHDQPSIVDLEGLLTAQPEPDTQKQQQQQHQQQTRMSWMLPSE